MNPSAASNPLVMKDAEYRMFRELLVRHCGLDFVPATRFLVENRIGRRIRDLGLGSFAAYHFVLRSDPAGEQELSRLIDELTTNETYFFRERRQLRALVEELLPELRMQHRAHGSGPVTLWSAGCSSGEEPYTIVMMAVEAGLEPGKDFRLYASDISRSMLQKARRGVYREASFRETEPVLRDRYFIQKDGLYRISDEIKRHVDFIHLNLLDRSRVALLGTLDVVMCRNVIIYFDPESRRRVIQMFYEKLRPGGHLLLGHSESLINLSSAFELRHLRNDLVYRRPGLGEEPSNPWHLAAAAAVARVDDPRSSR